MWVPGAEPPAFTRQGIIDAVARVRESLYVVADANGALGMGFGGMVLRQDEVGTRDAYRLLAQLPPLYPEWLGDRSFAETHGTRFPYVVGAMANGIATADLVIAAAENGMMGFFGAAGLTAGRVEENLARLSRELDPRGLPWGSNLIHSPNEADLEQEIVDLYLRRGVRKVSASAYMGLTPMLVQYAFTGVHRDKHGHVVRPNAVFAKISRPETAERFLSPPPKRILDALVTAGRLSATEADLAARLPVAEDVIVESDSGGHTDNQPLGALFPTICEVRDRLTGTHGYVRPIRLGAAGGIGTPASVASAFALGAAFVLTGSVNQAAVESGLSDDGRKLLAQTGLADVIMAPAADMFELGVEVQVLKRGTMFAPRARSLYELYRSHASLDEIPADTRVRLETQVFQSTIDEVWAGCESFFSQRNPAELERAAHDPKHKMALVFRWYLGQSSKWAIAGDSKRRMDFQIWCGPAMGAFNDWVRGSFLENPDARSASQIALNLLEGGAVVTRAQQLRSYGVPVPAQAFRFHPRPLS